MKKRMISLLLCMLFLLSGCGSSQKDAVVITDSESGTVFSIPQAYLDKGLEVELLDEDSVEHPLKLVYWYYTPVTDKIFDDYRAMSPLDITEEQVNELLEQLSIHSKCILALTMIPEEEYTSRIAAGETATDMTDFDKADLLAKEHGFAYLVSIPENDTEGMSAEEKKLYDDCHSYAETIRKNIKFTEIVHVVNEFPESIDAFSTKDLNGNTVTNSIFADKDLTVINIWGTFCGPCINEMPELGQWAKEMPENVQIIGLVYDVESENDTKHLSLAKQITSKADAEFTHLIYSSDFAPLLNGVVGVPTTVFVDSTGKLVGEPVVGAQVPVYKSFVEAYIHG